MDENTSAIDHELMTVTRQIFNAVRRERPDVSRDWIEDIARQVILIRRSIKDGPLRMIADHIAPLDLLRTSELFINTDQRLSAYQRAVEHSTFHLSTTT